MCFAIACHWHQKKVQKIMALGASMFGSILQAMRN
jgi:hypothetical protein